MSAAAARVAVDADHDWFAAYVSRCQRLGCSDRALRDRLRCARAFLAAHPDLHTWMSQPVTERMVELKRSRAWPLVVFLIGTGRLRLDLELAGAKNLTGLADVVEAQHAEEFADARSAGLRLGWTPGWVDTVIGECLAVLLAWHGGTVADLSTDVVAQFDEQLGQTMSLSRSSLRAYRARLRQLLFEIGVHDQPPRRRPCPGRSWSASPRSPWPSRSGPCCCAMCRPGPASCGRDRWSRWSTTCCRSLSSSLRTTPRSPACGIFDATTSRSS
jgi:hypothetical protein